jgi:hypothetical protein
MLFDLEPYLPFNAFLVLWLFFTIALGAAISR